MSDNNEAVKIAEALRPVVRNWVKEWTHSCVRAKQMKIVTAPSAETGEVGVSEAFGSEMFIPYSTALSSAQSGDVVWCVWMADNPSTMVAMWTGNLT